MTTSIDGVAIPDSQLAREIAQMVRDTESDLLFNHVKADVLADKDPTFCRGNFRSVIRESAWPA